MLVLVLNAGSSSQKSCLYDLDRAADIAGQSSTKPIWSAHLDWTVAQSVGVLQVKSNDQQQEITVLEKDQALKTLLNTLVTGTTKVLDDLAEIELVGHRVVHGGAKYSQPVVIDAAVKQAIADLIPLAPSHNPANLEGIETMEEILPQVVQVAVFDTAFHCTMPEIAKIYPLPYKYYEQGIQRYGFHGISHQYCIQRVAQILQQPVESLKIITCHLGNGCSLAASSGGKCVDTTMGFSPLEGLMMGTRCGSIDPQIPLYLMQEYDLAPESVNQILNQESGLKGVSGVAADLRTIIKAIDDGNMQAQLALDIYIYRLQKAIGSMVASLNGIDALVFTAGVGENSAIVRARTCLGLSYLGLQLSLAANNEQPQDINIAAANSQVQILVIKTQEDWAIAQQALLTSIESS
ncbi:MAG: acetate kinase [Cyanobacteria bacterium P01_C01_bin.72]